MSTSPFLPVEIEAPREEWDGQLGDVILDVAPGFPEQLFTDGNECAYGEHCAGAVIAHDGRVVGADVGWSWLITEDTYGREIEGTRWVETWRLPDGRVVCADCREAWLADQS